MEPNALAGSDFQWMVDAHHEKIYRAASMLLMNRHEAEDPDLRKQPPPEAGLLPVLAHLGEEFGVLLWAKPIATAVDDFSGRMTDHHRLDLARGGCGDLFGDHGIEDER